ncbi:MAG: VOC family protein [Anaeromyxobacteraceae bacterium]
MAETPPTLSLLILAVESLPRALAFYRAAFGWEQVVDAPVYAEFRLPAGLRLGLYDRRAFAANTGRAPAATPAGELAPTELYLYPEDLAATLARVQAAGARTLTPLARRDWGDEVAYLADPDGNVLALARPSPA